MFWDTDVCHMLSRNWCFENRLRSRGSSSAKDRIIITQYNVEDWKEESFTGNVVIVKLRHIVVDLIGGLA